MLAEVKEILRQLKLSTVTTGNAIFYIHCSLTSIIMLGLSMLTIAVEYYGTRIKCIPDIDYSKNDHIKFHQEFQDKHQDFFTTFCWMNSTYYASKSTSVNRFHGDIHRYPYYKWVSAALVFHAVFFYIPKIIWDSLEKGLIKHLVKEVKTETNFKDYPTDQKKKIIKNLQLNLKRNENYAPYYWICEALCLVNVIVQLILMNIFLDGKFLSYGCNMFTHWFHGESHTFMDKIFPRITKCTFFKEGSTTMTYDFICILPVNVVNKRTYLFLWIWLISLLGVLASLIIYRAVMIIFPSVRPRIFCLRNKLHSLEDAFFISTKLDIIDWWIVYTLCYNLDQDTCRDLVEEWVNTMKSEDKADEKGAHDGLDDPAIT